MSMNHFKFIKIMNLTPLLKCGSVWLRMDTEIWISHIFFAAIVNQFSKEGQTVYGHFCGNSSCFSIQGPQPLKEATFTVDGTSFKDRIIQTEQFPKWDGLVHGGFSGCITSCSCPDPLAFLIWRSFWNGTALVAPMWRNRSQINPEGCNHVTNVLMGEKEEVVK